MSLGRWKVCLSFDSSHVWCLGSVSPALMVPPLLWWAQWNKHNPNLTQFRLTRAKKRLHAHTLASLCTANLRQWHLMDCACKAASQHATTSSWRDLWPSMRVFPRRRRIMRRHCDGSNQESLPAAANLQTSFLCSLRGEKCICGLFLALFSLTSGNDKDVESQAPRLRRQERVPLCRPSVHWREAGTQADVWDPTNWHKKKGWLGEKLYLCTDQSKVLLTEVWTFRTFGVRSIVAVQQRSSHTFYQMHHRWWWKFRFAVCNLSIYMLYYHSECIVQFLTCSFGTCCFEG